MTKKSSGAPSMLTGSPPRSLIDPATSSPPSAGPPTDGDKTGGLDQLIDQWEEWWARTDRGYQAAIARGKEPVSCTSCPHDQPGCCFQKVIVTVTETLPIVRYLLKAGRDTPEFRERLRMEAIVMEAGDREKYFHEGHPCVFLENGRCSIYAVRPTACRGYYVISDPAKCQPGRHDGILKIDDSKYVGESLKLAMGIHRMLGLSEGKHRILMGALPRLVLMALEMWESDDFQGFIHGQPWPNDQNLDEWIDRGIPEYREKLYQIRTSKDGSRRPE